MWDEHCWRSRGMNDDGAHDEAWYHKNIASMNETELLEYRRQRSIYFKKWYLANVPCNNKKKKKKRTDQRDPSHRHNNSRKDSHPRPPFAFQTNSFAFL